MNISYRNGGHCYRKCEGRTIITRTKSGAIGSYRGSGTEGRQFYCLWILTVHESLEKAINPRNALLMGSHAAIPPITLTIEKDLAVVCARVSSVIIFTIIILVKLCW